MNKAMLSVHHPSENLAAAPMGKKSRASAASRPPTGASRPPTAGSARPTSAAIRHVSAANMAGSPPPGARLGSARYGRSASPSGGRGPRRAGSRCAPTAAVTAWPSAPPSAAASRRGSMAASEDDGNLYQSQQQPQAWAAFENSIKEIADDTLYFTQKQHRNFRSSEAFKQVLTDINYVHQVEVTGNDDDDVSLLSFRPGSVAGTADGSVAPSAADGEWTERQSVLSYADDDCVSVSRTSGLGRKSPSVVHFMRGGGGGDYPPSSAMARLTPAAEEPDEVDDGAVKVAATFLPVADLYTEPTDMRGELYQRYLHRPDTWTAGLTRHLHKTVTRERLPASTVWKTTQIFRPKSAIVNGTRYDNSTVRFKRIQSALSHLPGHRTHTERNGPDYNKRATTPVKANNKAFNAFR